MTIVPDIEQHVATNTSQLLRGVIMIVPITQVNRSRLRLVTVGLSLP